MSVEDWPTNGSPSQPTAYRLGWCWLLHCSSLACKRLNNLLLSDSCVSTKGKKASALQLYVYAHTVGVCWGQARGEMRLRFGEFREIFCTLRLFSCYTTEPLV